MPRVSRSEISATISKYTNAGYKVVSKEETPRCLKQTLYNEALDKTLIVKYTSNGWLTIT